MLSAASAAVFDPELAWQKARSVALRPEPFGALVYHFGNRKLSFLKSKTLVAVVEALADHPSATATLTACGVTDAWCDMVDDGHGVWDYLASVLILEEAGGAAAEVFGRELCMLDHAARRSPVVAATPELLDSVLHHRRR